MVLAAVSLGLGTTSAAARAQQQPSPNTALEAELYGVSCASASACAAVGDEETSAGATVALAERWNGTNWAVQSAAVPTGAEVSYLNGVSCTSATACTAVGNYVTGAGVSSTLAERWNGTSWSVQATPNPSGATGSFLDAVSCGSATACTATGYFLSGGAYQMLIEGWNGTTWSVQSPAAPSGATAGFLDGVSCTSATACTATGYYTSGTSELTLAERWNGTGWTLQSTPNPTGATSSELYGVSCGSATACTAVGNYETSAGANVTLAEHWDGTSWAVQSTPNSAGATLSFLNGISCTSATACTATGWYEETSGVYETLAEAWNGTSWTIQSTPNPTGAADSYLLGVSCASASACTAVGYALNSTYTTLAEGWNGTTWSIRSTPSP